MGAAAYNRGTKLISAQLDAAQPSADARKYTDLTNLSAKSATRMIWLPTVVRFTAGEVHLMSRQDRGFGEFSYSYDSLWQLFGEWRLAIVGEGSDKHGRFLRVVPIPKQTAQE